MIGHILGEISEDEHQAHLLQKKKQQTKTDAYLSKLEFFKTRAQKIGYFLFLIIEMIVVAFSLNIVLSIITKKLFDSLIYQGTINYRVIIIFTITIIVLIICVRPLVLLGHRTITRKNIISF